MTDYNALACEAAAYARANKAEARVRELEAENAALKAKLARVAGPHEMDETSPYDLVEVHKRRPGRSGGLR